MKKLFSVLVVGLLLIAFACGGGGKYADVKKVMQDNIDATEKFANSLEKADSADDVAAAINDYSDSMEKFIPKMKELQEKYSELNDPGKMPEDLKEIMEKMTALQTRMQGARAKIQQYGTDPKVQAASMKLMEVMTKMTK